MLSPLIDRLKTLILLTDIEARKNVFLLLGEESEKEVHFPDRENWNTGIIVDEQLNERFDEWLMTIHCQLVCPRKIDRIGTWFRIDKTINRFRERDRDMLFN